MTAYGRDREEAVMDRYWEELAEHLREAHGVTAFSGSAEDMHVSHHALMDANAVAARKAGTYHSHWESVR